MIGLVVLKSVNNAKKQSTGDVDTSYVIAHGSCSYVPERRLGVCCSNTDGHTCSSTSFKTAPSFSFSLFSSCSNGTLATPVAASLQRQQQPQWTELTAPLQWLETRTKVSTLGVSPAPTFSNCFPMYVRTRTMDWMDHKSVLACPPACLPACLPASAVELLG